MIENKMKDFTTSSFGDSKLSKENELNASMSVTNDSRDEYASKIASLGGA